MFFAHQTEKAVIMVIGLGFAVPAMYGEPVQIGNRQDVNHRI
jgi:hypothetical protein